MCVPHAQFHLTICDPMDYRLLFPWNFFRQEYLSGLPFYSPRDLSKPICVSCVSMIARRYFTSELSFDMNENIIKQNEIKK